MRGGYGYGATDPDARDFETYATILSGDVYGDDSYRQNRSDNNYSVVTCTASNHSEIDGFTIVGGSSSYGGRTKCYKTRRVSF